jgi:hypothetical protein
MKKKLYLLFFLLVASIFDLKAQVKISGLVQNEEHVGIEYATICVDSIFTLTDKEGRFALEIPVNIKSPMTCSHISYKKKMIPYSQYKGGNVCVVMEDRVYDIAEASVAARKGKATTILRKGMKLPGDVAFGNAPSGKIEIGPKFKASDNFIIDYFNLHIEECTYEQCILRLIVYKVVENQFEPVSSKPIYINLSPVNKNSDVKIMTNSPITLQKGNEYFVGLSIVSGSQGTIHFPAALRKGIARNVVKGTMKNLPATVGIAVIGRRLPAK